MGSPIGVLKAFCMAAVCGAIGLLPAKASVIQNDATLEKNSGFNDYVVILTQSVGPSGDGLFAFTINDLGSSDFRFDYLAIAELFSVFNASYNLSFTTDYVKNNACFFSNNNAPGSAVVHIPIGASIYLAYWDDRAPFESTVSQDDSYGWLQLKNTSSGLTLLGSATATREGIIVGTIEQVPEPGTLLLLGSGIGFILYRRRRAKTAQGD